MSHRKKGLEILKANDTPIDYTYFHSDENNYKDCVEIVDLSKFIKEQCLSYNLPYYETAYNREKVLHSFIYMINS